MKNGAKESAVKEKTEKQRDKCKTIVKFDMCKIQEQKNTQTF